MKLNAPKAVLAALALGAAPVSMIALSAPAAAQIVPGIAIANPDAIVAASSAVQNAETQRQTTYKAQIDQAEARRAQIAAQLEPLYTKLEADSQAASPNRQALQQQAAQIQQIEQSGQAEINRMLQPVALSRAYVVEQISDQLTAAMDAAKAKRKITLVISPSAVISAEQAYNLNQDVVNELNRLIPNAQLVPPAGWMPRAQREAAAAQQQAQQPAAAAPAGR
jgi:Skp family chaperone for outer membrane proteins